MAQHSNDLPDFQARRPVSDLEYVYDALKQSFMIGEFEPGQRLTLPLLAEAFGTSQMPIREAMNRLVMARAMESLPRRTPRVPEASTERLDALLPLRLLLEGEATRIAARCGCTTLAAELAAINLEMDAMVEAEDRKGYLRLNKRFHFTLYGQCQNPELIDVIESLWMRYGPLLNVVGSQVLSSTGHQHHAAVIAGIEANDPEAAALAIQADISDAARAIRAAIAG